MNAYSTNILYTTRIYMAGEEFVVHLYLQQERRATKQKARWCLFSSWRQSNSCLIKVYTATVGSKTKEITAVEIKTEYYRSECYSVGSTSTKITNRRSQDITVEVGLTLVEMELRKLQEESKHSV